MDIQLEKSKFIKRLERLNDIQVLKALNSMLDFALKKELEADLVALSTSEYNKELEEADKEIASGHYFTQQDALKISEEWKKQGRLK